MDAHLKLLADASLDLAAAEEALADEAFHTARERLDAVQAGLADLRERWAAMSGAERKIVGAAAAPVRARLDAAERRVPKLSALSVGAAEADPEQETDPEAA